MADTKGLSELDKWIRRIFSPERVIAGHNEQSESGSDPAILSFTLAYLKDCREAAERAKRAGTIVSVMANKYPTLAEKDTLSFGVKVFTGKAKWVRKDLSPGIGHHVIMDFSPASIFDVELVDSKKLAFLQTEGEGTDMRIPWRLRPGRSQAASVWSTGRTTPASLSFLWRTGTPWKSDQHLHSREAKVPSEGDHDSQGMAKPPPWRIAMAEVFAGSCEFRERAEYQRKTFWFSGFGS